jgi:hypothetical protein
MTKKEENESIASWAGLECRCEPILVKNVLTHYLHNYWGYCPRHCNGGLPPDYDRDEVAKSLLPIIVRKEYTPCLRLDLSNQWRLELYFNDIFIVGYSKPTIAAAIKAVVLQLKKEQL